jgi:hypothetical protein
VAGKEENGMRFSGRMLLGLVLIGSPSVAARERDFCVDSPLCAPDVFRIALGDQGEPTIRLKKGDRFDCRIQLDAKSDELKAIEFGVTHDPAKLKILELIGPERLFDPVPD